MENKNIPIYEFLISEEKINSGDMLLTAISIVDQPAILVDFLKFSENLPENILELKFSDESKNELVGPIMIPGMKIYRNDEMGEYYGFFSDKTCEVMGEDLMQKGLTKNFSLMHNGTKIDGAFLKEIWYEGVNAKSIATSADGKHFNLPKKTIMANVKITPEIKKIINEEGLKGFSIECFADAKRVMFAERCNITSSDVALAKIKAEIMKDEIDEIKLSTDFALEYWNKKCSCSNCRTLKAMGYQMKGVLPSSHVKEYKLS